MSRFSHHLTRRSIALSALAVLGSAASTACQDDAPSLVAPPSKASPAKSGTAGKPGSAEQILFTGITATNADIYIVNADGTNLRRVTSDTTSELEGAFSPDNKRFVYVRKPGVRDLIGDEHELWTAYTDGSKRTLVLKMNARVSHPRFSPDGTKIVFSAFVSDADLTEIFVVNVDGTGLKRLTYDAGDDDMPTWSPDGITIAWVTNRGGKAAVFLMNADGLNPRPRITDCEGGCVEPAFSPNGRKIAYVDPLLKAIRVFDLDGEAPTVSVGPIGTTGTTESPTWTKDGTRVVFSSSRGIEGNSELYIGTPGKTNATDIRRLTVFGPGSAIFPVYSN